MRGMAGACVLRKTSIGRCVQVAGVVMNGRVMVWQCVAGAGGSGGQCSSSR